MAVNQEIKFTAEISDYFQKRYIIYHMVPKIGWHEKQAQNGNWWKRGDEWQDDGQWRPIKIYWIEKYENIFTANNKQLCIFKTSII